MKEIIKPIILDGEDTGWKASNYGYVINTRGEKSFGSITTNGYYKIKINQHQFQAHRLIALVFFGEPPNTNPDGTTLVGQAVVNHKDEDKKNNRTDNLEWCDRSYNESYGTKQKRRVEKLAFVYKCINTGEVGTAQWFCDHYGLDKREIAKVADPNNGRMTTHGLSFKLIKGRD